MVVVVIVVAVRHMNANDSISRILLFVHDDVVLCSGSMMRFTVL